MSLQKITSKLGKAYARHKKAEKEKEKERKAFFEQATEELSDLLMEQVIDVFALGEEEVRIEIGKLYPKWDIVDIKMVGGSSQVNLWEAVIRENPAYKPFKYVNTEDGQVYQRQIQSGALLLDDDRLKKQDPDLWEEVSYVPSERVVKPFEELPAEVLARLGTYIYEGKPTVKLAAPRTAKDEELEEGVESAAGSEV